MPTLLRPYRQRRREARGDLATLPDLLRPGLDLVFVGINPGLHSARVGHYFAAPTNRFWPAANQAGIFRPPLEPRQDRLALEQGIGFTDVVKRPSGKASEIKAAEFREGAIGLHRRLLEASPRLVCFNGMTAYRAYLRHAEGVDARPQFGVQVSPIGQARVFVAPSPSPANAAYSLEDLIGRYRRVADLLHDARSAGQPYEEAAYRGESRR